MWTKLFAANIIYLYGVRVLTIDEGGNVYCMDKHVSGGWTHIEKWFDNKLQFCFYENFGADTGSYHRDELYPYILSFMADPKDV